MPGDECSIVSATLRFPFQASLDGSSRVETDGNFHYALDFANAFTELQGDQPVIVAEPETIGSEMESETKAKPGTEAMADFKQQSQQQPFYKEPQPFIYRAPRWDSLLHDIEPDATTSRPVSMMPHRINTSDQQRFAAQREMAAQETQHADGHVGMEVEEEEVFCESPTSTIEAAPAAAARLPPRINGPPRFYATPIVPGDPTTVPVLLYGLEQPSEHRVRPKKLTSRSRNYHSGAPNSRPSSRHGLSPLSSSIEPGIPEDTEPPMATGRLSVLMKRSSTYLPLTTGRPGAGSTYSSGSASTTSTVRSSVTATTEDSNYEPSNTPSPATSTSSSPTLNAVARPDQKPMSDTPSPTMVRANTLAALSGTSKDHQPNAPSPPPQVIRRKTAPISDTASVYSVAGERSRRSSIFGFNLRKFSPMGNTNRSYMRSTETLSTILAEDNVEPMTTNNGNIVDRAPSSASTMRPMPFSPDSIGVPREQDNSRGRARYRTSSFKNANNPYNADNYTNNKNNDNRNDNDATSPETIRPHTSYNSATASSSSIPTRKPTFSATPRVRNFSRPRNTIPGKTQQQQPPIPQSPYQQQQQQQQPGKAKNAANRASKFLSRVLK